jgi:hypothetical protein
MKRSEFLKSAAAACLVSPGSPFRGGQEAPPATGPSAQERLRREREERFKEAYILTLMENIERRVDPVSRVLLMRECGRACARRGGLLKLAREHRGDLKAFVAAAAGILGPENVRFLDEATVHWSYPRCYCELVAHGPERLPALYCECSVGWVLEMFETALQRPVQVRLLQSIKSGGASCVFRVETAAAE